MSAPLIATVAFGYRLGTSIKEQRSMRQKLWLMVLLLLLALCAGGIPTANAQSNTVELTGRIAVLYGDMPSADPRGIGTQQLGHKEVYLLQTDDGGQIQLNLTAEQAAGTSAGARVKIQVATSDLQKDTVEALSVQADAQAHIGLQSNPPLAGQAGPQPYLLIRCEFAGESILRSEKWFKDLFETMRPHSALWYWDKQGINISGSTVHPTVATIGPLSEYRNEKGDVVFWRIADACVQAAGAAGVINNYAGVNLAMSSMIEGSLWGGRTFHILGSSKGFGVTFVQADYWAYAGGLTHEMGHSLCADDQAGTIACRGLSHTSNATKPGQIHNFWDTMSNPHQNCADSTEWICSGQGLTFQQLRRAGSWRAQTSNVWKLAPGQIGSFEIELDDLYSQQLQGGHFFAAEVEYSGSFRLALEVRCGGNNNSPDFKMGSGLCGVIALDVDEYVDFKGARKFQDLLMHWRGDGTKLVDTVGKVGDKLTWVTGATVEILAKTPSGFRVKIDRRGDAKVEAYVFNFQALIIARDFSPDAALPKVIPVVFKIDGKMLPAVIATRDFSYTPPTWIASWAPCKKGTHTIEVISAINGIGTQPNKTTVTCADPVNLPMVRQ